MKKFTHFLISKKERNKYIFFEEKETSICIINKCVNDRYFVYIYGFKAVIIKNQE